LPVIWTNTLKLLTGNITRKDGDVYLHIHIAASGEDGSVIGGHLNEARISATAEIFISKFNGNVERKNDHVIGLNVLDFS
jgi:predicted DNA-binding protein with PD1-like motif